MGPLIDSVLLMSFLVLDPLFFLAARYDNDHPSVKPRFSVISNHVIIILILWQVQPAKPASAAPPPQYKLSIPLSIPLIRAAVCSNPVCRDPYTVPTTTATTTSSIIANTATSYFTTTTTTTTTDLPTNPIWSQSDTMASDRWHTHGPTQEWYWLWGFTLLLQNTAYSPLPGYCLLSC